MGQGGGRQLFVQMLKTMLRSTGVKTGKDQIRTFLEFVEKVCPWFLEEGTVNLETWERIGKQLQDYYTIHGPSKVPVETFGLWGLVRDCLDPRHEKNKLKEQIQLSAPPFEGIVKNRRDELSPEEEAELEEEAARYHGDDREQVLLSLEQKRNEGKEEAAPLSPLDNKEGCLLSRLQELEEAVKKLHGGVTPTLTDAPELGILGRGMPLPSPAPL